MTYLLDTNMCIALLSKKEDLLIQRLKQHRPDEFYLCSVVKAELLFGAKNSSRVEENMQTLEKFFSQFFSLPFDDRSAVFYGETRFKLRKSGKVVGTNDLLIACIAKAFDLIVLTRNRSEFLQIPGLRLETW